MTCLGRFLIVLALALLSMQGAFAHEHVTPMPDGAGAMMVGVAADADPGASDVVSSMPSHYAGMAPSGTPVGHDHCACCTTFCGVYCGVLFAAFHFEPRKPGATPTRPLLEARRDGVTRAPPVPPPIG